MTDDDRVMCITCANRQRGQGGLMACMQPRRAGLNCQPRATYIELGRDLATLPQRCPAYIPKPAPKENRNAPARV